MQLRALKFFPYDGKPRRPGDVFGATEHDGGLLVAIGQAAKVESVEQDEDDKYEQELARRRVAEGLALYPAEYMTAALKKTRGQRGPDKQPRKKRVYQRRDMVAE